MKFIRKGVSLHFLAAGLILLLTTLLLYFNSLAAGFHLDDFRIITENPAFKFSRLSIASLMDVMGTVPSRAITMATFAVNHVLGGEDVFGYHVVSILLHGLVAIVLYVLIYLTLTHTPGGMIGLERTRIAPSLLALWSSLLWVAHPIQTQAVTYIVQRSSILAALFFLLTLLCYLNGRLALGRKRAGWFGLGVLMAGLALGSKETAVMLPLALWLYEVCFFTPAGRSPLTSNLRVLWLVFGLMGGVAITVVYVAYGGPQEFIELFSGRSDTYKDFSLWQRMLTKGRVVALYLSLLLVPLPSRLNLDHNLLRSSTLWSPASTVPAWLFVGACMMVALVVVRQHRFVGFWLLWFFLNIALESSIVSNELVFEHRLYLPSMGFVTGLVAIAAMTPSWMSDSWVGVRGRGMLISIIFISLLVSYGSWTIERNRVWKNEMTLWNDVVSKSPGSFRARTNLGFAYEDDGQFEQARREYEVAKQLDPSSFRPSYGLGWVYYQQRDWEKAAVEVEHALTRDHSFHFEALLRRLLGSAYAKQGREPEAIVQWERAYDLEPQLNDLPEDLGWAYLGDARRWEDAKSVLQEAVKLHPKSVRARFLLGLAFEKTGELSDAGLQYRFAIDMGKGTGETFVEQSRRRLTRLDEHDQE